MVPGKAPEANWDWFHLHHSLKSNLAHLHTLLPSPLQSLHHLWMFHLRRWSIHLLHHLANLLILLCIKVTVLLFYFFIFCCLLWIALVIVVSLFVIYSFGCFELSNLLVDYAFLAFKVFLLLLDGVLLVFFVFLYSCRFFLEGLRGPYRENNQKMCRLGQLSKLS